MSDKYNTYTKIVQEIKRQAGVKNNIAKRNTRQDIELWITF